MKLTVGLPKMGIRIKDLNLDSMEVTKRGVELAFYEDGKHAGDLIIKPTELIWNKGKTSRHGLWIDWPSFFKLMRERAKRKVG